MEREELSAKLGAARALVLLGHTDQAMPVLLQTLAHENEYARLSAVETLEIAGLEHPGVREALEGVMNEKETYPRRIAATVLGVKIR